ncbi:hypothetical protein Q5L94_08380 [Idiomarina sp. Sol25]|uniref:hypothetical protein n=1 Tax=Idiomarina sp. Sol25 TaxID=3064000 RepID=UPI00294B28F0|nr:hypothetical protein [Idiomarina sp. Sol25]MDV6328073.1 hypothetical protein [Idiomarina sp. Sol25]
MTHPFSNLAFDHIVYIGAGQGDELNQLAKSLTAKHWNVVDASENNVQKLNEVKESLQEQGVSIEVQQKVVASSAEKATWYNYNLAEFNGLHKATELKALFPGLKLMSSESVTPTPLEELLDNLNVTGDNNLLVIDLPAQGLELAKALSETPYKRVFNFMCVGSQAETLFESSNTAAELKSWLLENGYHTRNEEVDDPDFPKLHFVLSQAERKLANELKQAQEQIEQANAERDQANAELEHANEAMHKRTEWAQNLQAKLEKSSAEKRSLLERANKAEKRSSELEKQLQSDAAQARERAEALQAQVEKANVELSNANEEKQKQAEWAHSLQAKLDQALAEKDKLAERAETVEARNSELQKKLEAAEKYNEQLAKLNERMDSMFEQQRLQLEQATNALGRHITQTSSQQVTELKARLSLERTFGKSLINLNENDSNLSEVTAVTLTQQLEDNSYDLIIEFGAGKSTEFLANAIINNHSPNQQLENKSGSNDFEASDFDLPQHVLSFEHDKKQFNSVKQRIEQHNLQNLVDLKYAPLIPVSQSQELFYDCERALTNVSSVLDGRDAKVLILINSSASQKQPSYPASVPTLLNSLSAFSLDVVISYKTSSEKTIEDWQQLISERGLEFENKGSRDMCFLRINS